MLKISSSVTSNAGKKNINEDNFYMNGIYMAENNAASGRIYSDGTQRSVQFYAVFDGIGEDIKSAANINMDFYEGHNASFAAADMLARLQRHLKTKEDYNIHNYINTYLKKTNKNICDYMRQRGIRTGTSLALLCMNGNYAYAYNIGSSKIFLYRDNRITLISKNDTHAERLVAAKKINADIARHTPDHKILTQHLGMFENEKPPELHTNRISLRAGDKFLICTDGLCDLAQERIYQIMARDISEQEIVTDLMNEVLRNGSGENITALVAGINYGDEMMSKVGLQPASPDSPTHWSPIVFRNRFEFKPKHIKYILLGVVAFVILVVLVTAMFNGPLKPIDPTENNNAATEPSREETEEGERGTGNIVITSEPENIQIDTYDPDATFPDEPTEAETTFVPVTETPAAQPVTQQPIITPTAPPPTNPPAVDVPATEETEPPPTEPAAETTEAEEQAVEAETTEPAEEPTEPPAETPTEAQTEPEPPPTEEPTEPPPTDAPTEPPPTEASAETPPPEEEQNPDD